MSSGQAGYYLGLAREDYYLEGGEPPGQWFGAGAEWLGLQNEVDADHLYNLFDGLSPDGSASLTQRQKHEGKAVHRPGWDLTFSAPKSVSVLWSQASPEMRSRIQEAHAAAVQAALTYLQDTSVWTRRGARGSELEPARLVAACFEHSTSRALDPQLHTHALVMNLGIRSDGTAGTLSSLHMFQAKMTAGALYRAELATVLARTLGLPLEQKRTWFEIPGVAPSLIEEFSKRREAIERVIAERGLDTAEGAAIAAIETRDAKSAVSRDELFKLWRAEGMEHGWSTQEAAQLFGAIALRNSTQPEAASLLSRTISQLTQSLAYFSAREFLRTLAENAQVSGLSAKELLRLTDLHLAESADIVRLGVYRGEQRFTTREMLEIEKKLMSEVGALSTNDRLSVSAESLMRALSKEPELSEEQMKAVFHATHETGGFAAVSGMAGTGKTRMLEACRKIWQAEGYDVQGAAVARLAADQLESGAGIASSTIAKLLFELQNGRLALTGKSILVVDEAGMIASPEMEKIALACREAGAKLVLVGDERQLQPIGPGAPFKELGNRFGRAELTEIRRQNEAWARKAVRDVAEGEGREALNEFAKRGQVFVGKSRKEAINKLIDDWATDDLPLSERIVLAGKRSEVSELNRQAQMRLAESGQLLGPGVQLSGEKIFQGDRVIFTKNNRRMGVANGARGTVVNTTEAGELTVRLDSGERVSFDASEFRSVSLGYASTTHKAQGATVQRAYILSGGNMQDRELTYVQVSRARERTMLYLTAAQAGDEVASLARQYERSRQKEMAHTVLMHQNQIERSI